MSIWTAQGNVQEKFKAIADEIVDMLVRKNEDYGDSNLLRYGLFGICVRLSDKVARLENMVFKAPAVDETLEDTLKDIAGYAVNAIRLLREKRLGRGIENFKWIDLRD